MRSRGVFIVSNPALDLKSDTIRVEEALDVVGKSKLHSCQIQNKFRVAFLSNKLYFQKQLKIPHVKNVPNQKKDFCVVSNLKSAYRKSFNKI